MIPFVILATVISVLVMLHLTRPLWRGQSAEVDHASRLNVYRERRLRLERDVEAGRLDSDEARRLREELDRELLEQIGHADPPSRSATHRPLAAALAVLLVAVSILVYLQLGRPDSLLPAESRTVDHAQGAAPSLEQAVQTLAARLQADPGNVDDWLLLARSYAALDRWAEARDALSRALQIEPDRADVLVDYAEALARTANARLEGEPMTLLQRALRRDPDNPKAVWLLGMGFYQNGEFARAADTWEQLLAAMPADEPARTALEKQISDARVAAGERPPARPAQPAAPAETEPAPETPTMAGDTAARLVVDVDLSPDLAAGLTGSEILFVFARAPEGPAIPLAVQRMPVSDFPVRVILDESMAMMPSMSLANFQQVVVGARISRTGTADVQAGDLQVLSDPVPVDSGDPVALVISEVVQP